MAVGVDPPPFKPAMAIAYNGSYWLMGGLQAIKETVTYEYQAVIDLRKSYDEKIILARNALIQKINEEKSIQYAPDLFTPSPTNWTQQYNEYIEQANDILASIPTTITQLDAEDIQTKVMYVRETFHTMARSFDGLNWSVIEKDPFVLTVTKPDNFVDNGNVPIVYSISWNGTLWIAVGDNGIDQNVKSQIATSTDGINWTPRGSAGNWVYGVLPNTTGFAYIPYRGACRSIANNGSSKWVIAGEKVGVLLEFNEQTQSRPTLEGTLSRSSNGIDWVPVPNSLQFANTVAYNGVVWVAGGRGGSSIQNHCIVTSSNDGVSWEGRFVYSTDSEGSIVRNEIKNVAWNGSYWLGVGTQTTTVFPDPQTTAPIVLKSTNTIDWTLTSTDIPELESICWDGNLWNGVGFSGIYRSSNGTTWVQKDVKVGSTSEIVQPAGYAIASRIKLPILGGTITIVNSFVVGFGRPMSAIRSFDNDTNWISQIIDGTGVNYVGNPQKEFFDVIWGGSKWVLVGQPGGNSIGNVAVSSNGLDWTFSSNNFLGIVRGIAYGSSTYIAVSEGGTGLNKVATSLDASSWTARTFSLTKGYCVAYNGTYWLAGGQKGTARAIVKSTNNGSNWIDANICPLDNVYSVAWNGYIWIAVGNGGSHSIALSIDGIRWYASETNPFTSCLAVAWNGSKWVAVGEGDNTIATSVDGNTWIGQRNVTFTVRGTSIAWNGSKWIAFGNGLTTVAESTDGETWTRFEIKIEKANKYANKTISLPYTPTPSDSVLSIINATVSLFQTKTDTTVGQEQIAAQQAADTEISAALLAAAIQSRNNTKSLAAVHRLKILFWKNRINREFLTLSTYRSFLLNASATYFNPVDLFLLYPYEYRVVQGLNDSLDIITGEVPTYMTIINDSDKPQVELNIALAKIQGYIDDIDADIVEYYNKLLFLYKKLIDDTLPILTSAQFETALNNYKYIDNTQKQRVLTFYNNIKTSVTTDVNSVLASFNITIPSVTYGIDITNYDYSTFVLAGETVDLSTVTFSNSDFLNKNYSTTDTINKSLPVVGQQNTYRTISFFITRILKTNAPDIENIYTDKIRIRNSSTNYGTLLRMNYVYQSAYERLLICNNSYNDAVTKAQNWYAIVSQTLNMTTLNSKFNPYYLTYFQAMEDDLLRETDSNYNYPLINYPHDRSIIIRYFQAINEEFTHPGMYPDVLGALYTAIKNKYDTIVTVREAAINYAMNRKTTVLRPKLIQFKQDITVDFKGSLSIDSYLLDILNKTYYSVSVLQDAFKLLSFLKFGELVYGEILPLYLNIKIFDIDADRFGAKPPITGWGGIIEAGATVTTIVSLPEYRYRINASVDSIKDLKVGLYVHFYTKIKNEAGVTYYRNQKRYDIVELNIAQGYFIIKSDTILFNEPTLVIQETATTFFAWQFSLKPADRGTSGNATWEVANRSYWSRAAFSSKINQVFQQPFRTGMFTTITIAEFLEFTRTTTYTSIITLRNNVFQTVDSINSNFMLTNSYIDTIISADSNTIDAAYNTQGAEVITNLFNSISLVLPSQSDLTAYGQFRLNVNNSTTLQTYVDSISTNLTTLTTLKNTSMTTYSKAQVTTAVSNAVQSRNNIVNIQGNPNADQFSFVVADTQYVTLMSYIQLYKQKLAAADTYVKTVEDRIYRFQHLYQRIQSSNNNFFSIEEEISGSTGKPFILSIPPSNVTYWRKITHPVVIYNDEKVQLTSALPALTLSEYPTYSETREYPLDMLVQYNNIIYRCINVGLFDGDTRNFIINVIPTNTQYWKSTTYPIVTYKGFEVEATPSFCSPLHYLDRGYYDNNWLYYVGDVVSYDGFIYECFNVQFSLPSDEIINKIPTNTQFWQLSPRQLDSYAIPRWQPTKVYTPGNKVLFNGDIYSCERLTSDDSIDPATDILTWCKRDTRALSGIPPTYKDTDSYSINDSVLFKTYNASMNIYSLLVYKCYTTGENLPVEYAYPVFYISNEVDSDDNYKIKKESDGTYLLHNTPRYGAVDNTTDPFCMLGFARGLRRRVAMEIDMPCEWAKRLKNEALGKIASSIYNFSDVGVTGPGITTLYNSYVSKLNSAIEVYNYYPNARHIMYEVAYSGLLTVLQAIVKEITAHKTLVNTIKTQYFNNPGTQARVFAKPFIFLNPISDATSNVKLFRDLGVGDPDDMKEREFDSDLLFRAGPAEFEYYEANQPRIDRLESIINDLQFYIKCITGYIALVAHEKSTYQIGSLIVCESCPNGVDLPITDENWRSIYLDPPTTSIIGQVTAAILEATRPPEYTLERDLSSALAYESTNPTMIGFTKFTKGLIGMSVAAFQSGVADPLMIFGVLNFISGGAIPNLVSTKWPSYRDVTQDKITYKKTVNFLKEKYKIANLTEKTESLNAFLISLTFLLDETLFMSESFDIKPFSKPTIDEISFTSQLPDDIEVPLPSGKQKPIYSPPTPPEVPIKSSHLLINAELKVEARKLRKQIANVEKQLNSLKGIDIKPPNLDPIPTLANGVTISQTGDVGPRGKVRTYKTPNTTYNRLTGAPIRTAAIEFKFNVQAVPGNVVERATTVDVDIPTVTQADVDSAIANNKRLNAKHQFAKAERNLDILAKEIELQDLKNGLASKANQITADEIDVVSKNAASDANFKAKQAAMAKYEIELDEARRTHALDKIKYNRAVQERDDLFKKQQKQQAANNLAARNAAVDELTDTAIKQANIKIKDLGATATQSKVAYDGKLVTVTVSIKDYDDALLDSTAFKGFINTKFAASLRASYAKSIAKLAPVFNAIRRAEVILSMTPVARYLARPPKVAGKLLESSRGAIIGSGFGVLIEVAVIGVVAWQDGSFDED